MATEKILFVDDEINILQSIQRQLRKRFEMQIASSGQEALQVLKTEGPFAVIVSDMRMPQMNGVELLTQVKDMYPDTVRLMLTGNADQETAMEAVNNGQIFRFLTKPCPPALFIPSLALAIRQHRLVTAEKEVLQQTLKGCVNVLSELLGITNPLAFSSGQRIKKLMVRTCESMDIPLSWEYEIAAMLSQIGCVSLPGDILTKVYAGETLSDEEQGMFDNHPQIGAIFLEKIPRLENISRMIELQNTAFNDFSEEIKNSIFEEIIIGTQILKAAIDFDRLLFRGYTRENALSLMQKARGLYNKDVLQALGSLEEDTEGGAILHIPATKIAEGMIAAEDIIAKNGILIVPKGQTITKPIKEGVKNFARHVGVVEPITVQLGVVNQAEESEDPGYTI